MKRTGLSEPTYRPPLPATAEVGRVRTRKCAPCPILMWRLRFVNPPGRVFARSVRNSHRPMLPATSRSRRAQGGSVHCGSYHASSTISRRPAPIVRPTSNCLAFKAETMVRATTVEGVKGGRLRQRHDRGRAQRLHRRGSQLESTRSGHPSSLSDLTIHPLISLMFLPFRVNTKCNNISVLRVSKTSSPTGC
jgi:hypothetical protein